MRIVGLVAAATMGVGLTGVSGVSATPISATVIDEVAAAARYGCACGQTCWSRSPYQHHAHQP